MEDKGEIINRVANSPLVTIDLSLYIPVEKSKTIDLKDLLFEGLILREKDLREHIKNHDWSQYQDCNVGIYCSSDAVIPSWAYMIITSKLQPYARFISYGSAGDLKATLLKKNISEMDIESYRDKKVVIKGCSNETIPDFAYGEITRLLTPVVSSIMYGEPCSTVPIYKRKG